MNRDNYWNEFLQTGSVDAYLKYKGIRLNTQLPKCEEIFNAVDHKGTDNKGPQYR